MLVQPQHFSGAAQFIYGTLLTTAASPEAACCRDGVCDRQFLQGTGCGLTMAFWQFYGICLIKKAVCRPMLACLFCMWVFGRTHSAPCAPYGRVRLHLLPEQQQQLLP